jgi:hypothetical protein
VVIAVLEENKIGELTPEMEEFRDMVRSVIERNRDRYHDHFQFGWTGTPDLANSVAMETLSLPNLLVVNSSSFQVKNLMQVKFYSKILLHCFVRRNTSESKTII